VIEITAGFSNGAYKRFVVQEHHHPERRQPVEALRTNTRISLSNILVTTDFSQVSKAALPYATALANQYEAKIVVAHAITPEPRLSGPVAPMPVEDDPAWLEADTKLAEYVLSSSRGVRPAKVLLERGDLWTVISGVIQKNEIDLVVTGTHGRQGLRKLVLGSAAEKIYRRAACPVLTIGPQVPALRGTDWKLKTILFPTDGSEASLKALPYALSLAEENEANLIFLQLMPLAPSEYQESDEASVRELLRALVPAEAEDWCKPEFVARFEFPAEGILRLAKERDVNLIVMGVRKSGEIAMQEHLPWPIASQVVAQAHCPVLTVRG
jgi:nucleotide-binding universal stress UspA family protein